MPSVCRHFWLPKQGRLFRYVVCTHCEAKRRVRFRLFGTEPVTIKDALGEAVDRRVLLNDEVTWGGGPVR